ncbi:hypothetical protein CROQUDRAFT_108440 [Cronartium quercuum f. sp. fusiforme G11]|uniref:Uncharacterized protein n=1 Tax=Cronartium quercuum f. sp. fusiforme G11 TaxID=708437 RepID=A0A9P6NI88_9BASI|nr:hypothetical protein CROQUDRAFT_108440 [Cronartium quercuum f. sp. fusiforme G11]
MATHDITTTNRQPVLNWSTQHKTFEIGTHNRILTLIRRKSSISSITYVTIISAPVPHPHLTGVPNRAGRERDEREERILDFYILHHFVVAPGLGPLGARLRHRRKHISGGEGGGGSTTFCSVSTSACSQWTGARPTRDTTAAQQKNKVSGWADGRFGNIPLRLIFPPVRTHAVPYRIGPLDEINIPLCLIFPPVRPHAVPYRIFITCEWDCSSFINSSNPRF